MEQWIAVGVAVENTAYHFDKEFTYLVPEGMCAVPGCRVLVPFGGANRKRQGLVISSQAVQSTQQLKPVAALLDEVPLLSAEQLLMIPWLKERYFCTLFDAAKLLLPIGINFKISTRCVLAVPFDQLEQRKYSETEWSLLLRLKQSPATEEEIMQLFEQQGTAQAALKRLLADEVITKQSEAKRRISDATQKMIRIHTEEEPDTLSPKQREVFRLLLTIGSVSVKELCYFAGVTPSVPDALVKKGLAVYFEEERLRTPYPKAQAAEPAEPVTLSQDQQQAYQNLIQQYRGGHGVSLLYGVTGSGKTQVFCS